MYFDKTKVSPLRTEWSFLYEQTVHFIHILVKYINIVIVIGL